MFMKVYIDMFMEVYIYIYIYIYMYVLVMQRFGNMKVGSVFGFLHPETAVSVSVLNFQKQNNIYIYIFLNKIIAFFDFGHCFYAHVRTAIYVLICVKHTTNCIECSKLSKPAYLNDVTWCIQNN